MDRRQLAMHLEHSLNAFEATLAGLPYAPANLTVQPSAWWALSRIVLAGFFLVYLVDMVQDVQRVRDLRAEPSPLAKIIVISKNEAWQRIYARPSRPDAPRARIGSRGMPRP
jgi:hypothetical protein